MTVTDDAVGTDDDAAGTDRAVSTDEDAPVTYDAITSSSGYDTCPTEIDACSDNTECIDCITGYSVDDYNQCLSDYDYNFDGSDTCTYYWAAACCMASASSNDCLGNTAFVGYITCFANSVLGEGECSTTTCSDGVLVGAGGTSGVGSSSPSAMLTLFLGLAFLTAGSFLDVLL